MALWLYRKLLACMQRTVFDGNEHYITNMVAAASCCGGGRLLQGHCSWSHFIGIWRIIEGKLLAEFRLKGSFTFQYDMQHF